jgi:hypothetical protein
LDSQTYGIVNSRAFAAGVLQISVGTSRDLRSGDVTVAPPAGH